MITSRGCDPKWGLPSFSWRRDHARRRERSELSNVYGADSELLSCFGALDLAKIQGVTALHAAADRHFGPP
jgi:hypothetical protein